VQFPLLDFYGVVGGGPRSCGCTGFGGVGMCPPIVIVGGTMKVGEGVGEE
jgi:hypothetical protein